MFGRDAAGVLDRILGHIAFYCKEHSLPQLNAIVVNKETGKPGHEIPLPSEHFKSETQKVFDEDWYDIHPPSKEALITAYKDHWK